MSWIDKIIDKDAVDFYISDYEKCAQIVLTSLLQEANDDFIIYPFGVAGKVVKSVLNVFFGIEELAIADNYLSKKYNQIISTEQLSDPKYKSSVVLVCSDNPDTYYEIHESLFKQVPKSRCVEVIPVARKLVYMDYANGVDRTTIYDFSFQVALQETAQYVNEKMYNLKPYHNRFELLEDLICNKVDFHLGYCAEFGVYNGNSLSFIATFKPDITFFGFDSFEGIPEDWFGGLRKNSFCAGKVPQLFNRNVELVQGWFDDSLPIFLENHEGNFSFIHIDCDVYTSTKTIFELLAKRIGAGTIIEFDEFFGYPGWKNHEFKAFIEFVEKNGVEYEYIGYTNRGSQVAVRIISINGVGADS